MAFEPALSSPFAKLQTPKTSKTPKVFQFLPGSFHQAWPSACAAPGLQPALCLHIPCGSFHQAPGRQLSIHLSLHLPIRLSNCLSIYLSISLSLSLSFSLSPSLYLCTYLAIHPSIHPSIYPSIYLSPSLCKTPQIGGVGGTRALAHSI